MRNSEDDLFKNSVMTFGEHLGELRNCLWRAILGLAVGLVAGLFVGHHVVRFIETPLTAALKKYYEDEALLKLKERAGGHNTAIEAELIKNQQLVFEDVLVDPARILKSLHDQYPDQFLEKPQGAEPTSSKDKLLPLRIYRNSSEVTQIVGMNPMEAFMIYFKASLLVGAILSSPWVFYQLWMFVAAGMYPRERHYVYIFLPFSLALFLGGAALAFFAAFPVVLKFLFQFNSWLGIGITPRISEWLSFVLLFPLCFGISFQLPLVMLFLERIGVFTVESYLSQWRVAVLTIFVLAMILNPSPDPGSMMLMAAPLVLLYFGGIMLCRRWPRSSAAR
jgi:sec-independent protein translocase protein TatC